MYIVTVKLPKNPQHDPHNKVAGRCPASPDVAVWCTDVTGEHHSLLVEDSAAAQTFRDSGVHVTRIEEVEL